MNSDIVKWISTGKNLELYQRWLDDPVTQVMIEAVRGQHRLRRLQNVTGDEALQELGIAIGRSVSADLLSEAGSFYSPDLSVEYKRSQVRYLVEIERMSQADAEKLVAMNYGTQSEGS